MPQGDKSAYTDKQKRKAEHIEEGYEKRGVSEKEAEARAWATVNAMDHGGKKSGSGRGKRVNKAPARKGGRKGAAARTRSTARKTSARKTTGRKTSGRKTTARKTARRRTSKKR
jgi:plasmid stabilization system protein ParE